MTDSARTAVIARAFGRAAPGYDAAATLQPLVAAGLANRIAALNLPPAPRVLEIGCGTGLLAAALVPRLAPSWYLASDIALPMLRACHRRATSPLTMLAMDGERPCFAEQQFDLVCSSLALQWFHDSSRSLAALHRLLRPGGAIAITTLGPGSLIEWRDACRAEDLSIPTPDFPPPEDLLARWPGRAVISAERLHIHHGDGLAFLRGLRATGAFVPRAGHPPIAAGALRRAAARLDASPRTTYEVLTLILH